MEREGEAGTTYKKKLGKYESVLGKRNRKVRNIERKKRKKDVANMR